MKFLIIIKDTSEKSKNIIQIGSKIAKAFSSNLSIIHVGKKSKALIESEVKLARLSMSEWNIMHPGIDVLQWAYNLLDEMDTFEIKKEALLTPEDFVEQTNRISLSLPQSSARNIELILREGKVIEEVAKEIDSQFYDLAIMGCPKKKRSIHQVVQFFNTSVLLVKISEKIGITKFNYVLMILVQQSVLSYLGHVLQIIMIKK